MKNLVWGAGLALLMSGCATVEMAKYRVTSFAEVPLKSESSVRIAANGKAAEQVVTALKKQLENVDSLLVVDGKADYWMIVNAEQQYKTSDAQKKWTVIKQENESGGQDVLAESTINLASAAKSVSVAVYETATLAPVHYFEIPIYSGDAEAGDTRTEEVLQEKFLKEAVERIMDTFVTQEKTVDTEVSKKGDGDLRKMFIKAGEAEDVGSEYAKVQAAICRKYADFVRKYKLTHGKIDLKKLLAAIESKEYDGKIAADTVLADYHMYLLVDEFNATRKQDAEKLNWIRDQHMMILEHSEEAGLSVAIPVALARLEYKLANLGK